jgi:glucose-1-phosphate cytidylyltransferase
VSILTGHPSFSPADTPVVILCGGMGTRLREASEKLPKPLVEVGGKPILWHVMKIYGHYGFRRFILCLGYKGDQIRRYFLEYRAHVNDFTLELAGNRPPRWHGDRVAEDWEITFVETGLLTGTGGRVSRVADHIDTDVFMLTYGDGIGAINIEALVKQHLESGRIGTVTGVHPASRYGEMYVAGNEVVEFKEKPKLATGWVSGGFFAFNRIMIDKYLNDEPGLVLEKEPLQSLAADGELGAYKHEGFWMGMDTFRDWTELNELWDSGNAPWNVWDN